MNPKELIGEGFRTAENYNGKPCGFYGWKIVGLLPNDHLELKQIKPSKKLRFSPLFGDKIGFGGNGKFAGVWHMPVPRFKGDVVW